MPGLMKRSFRELKVKMDLQKINLIYVHQILIRIKRTSTIPLFPIQTQTLIINMMILMMIVPQIIHLVMMRTQVLSTTKHVKTMKVQGHTFSSPII